MLFVSTVTLCLGLSPWSDSSLVSHLCIYLRTHRGTQVPDSTSCFPSLDHLIHILLMLFIHKYHKWDQLRLQLVYSFSPAGKKKIFSPSPSVIGFPLKNVWWSFPVSRSNSQWLSIHLENLWSHCRRNLFPWGNSGVSIVMPKVERV